MPQVQAVTGIKNINSLTACDDCHKGPQIDFVVVMQKTSDNMNRLPMLSAEMYLLQLVAHQLLLHASGIAALVWSAHPTETREQMCKGLLPPQVLIQTKPRTTDTVN
jgi:hypothetical protein